MLYGLWREDLDETMRIALGTIRKEAWGQPDLSSCLFRSSSTMAAVLYDRTPNWSAIDAGGDVLLDAVAESGRWPLMQRVQRDTIGIREMFVRVDAIKGRDGDLEILNRLVHPDMVIAECDPERPERPIRIQEARRRPRPGGIEWTWDDWSTTDGTLRIRDSEFRDISDMCGGVREMPTNTAGDPVLPFGTFHAARTGELWDAFELQEVVEGSLTLAMYLTYFGHILRNVAWQQRFILNARVAGLGHEGTPDGAGRDAGRDSIVTDPATVLMLESLGENIGQPVISQWQASADPMVIMEAIAIYGRQVAANAGINAADIQRVAGDPRSGFAIALNRDAQRESQRRYEPIFRPADIDLMRRTAVVANAAMGADIFPEDGYRVVYEGLPPSPEEVVAARAQADWETTQGLSSPVSVYMRLHPGTPPEAAADEIVRTQIESLRLKKDLFNRAVALGLQAPSPSETVADAKYITAVQGIVSAVTAGEISRESAKAILVNLIGQTPETADEFLGPAPIDAKPTEAPPSQASP